MGGVKRKKRFCGWYGARIFRSFRWWGQEAKNYRTLKGPIGVIGWAEGGKTQIKELFNR